LIEPLRKNNNLTDPGSNTEIPRTKTPDIMKKLDEKILGQIFSSLFEGLILIDFTHKSIHYINESGLSLLGYGSEEFERITLDDLFPKETLKFVYSILEPIHKSGQKSSYSIPFLKKNGTIEYFDLSISSIESGGTSMLVLLLKTAALKRGEDDKVLKYNLAFRMSSDAIIITNNYGEITEINQAAKRLLKIDDDSDQPLNAFNLIFDEDTEEKDRIIKNAALEDKPLFFEWSILSDNDELVPIEISISLMKDANNRKLGYVIIGRDVSERKRIEKEIRKSLGEKELLLKEIHHRVKNNLQVIHSILSLQSRYVESPEIIKMIEESQDRIKSMSFIHEYLYQSDDLSKIDMNHYIEKLCEYLHLSYSGSDKDIKIKMDCQNVKVDIQIATPCGLIINELVSNSLKHAFKDQDQGEIQIEFKRDARDRYRLKISDNGIGNPNKINFEKASTLGIRLIKILTEQLHGDISFDSTKGTECIIQFSHK
jgi:PAS domain S-box-containing protein